MIRKIIKGFDEKGSLEAESVRDRGVIPRGLEDHNSQAVGSGLRGGGVTWRGGCCSEEGRGPKAFVTGGKLVC